MIRGRYSQYHSKTGCDEKRRIVEIKRPFFTANNWQEKYLFFFAALCAERIVSTDFS